MKKFILVILIILILILCFGCTENGTGEAVKSLPEKIIQPSCVPTIETCDNKDNDCDSKIDEDNVCLCGDVDADNKVDSADVAYLIDFLYKDSSIPCFPSEDYVPVYLETKQNAINYFEELQNNPLSKMPPYPGLLERQKQEKEFFKPYVCGDVDGDKIVSEKDIFYLIDFVFDKGSAPVCSQVFINEKTFSDFSMNVKEKGINSPSELLDLSKLSRDKDGRAEFNTLAVLIEFSDNQHLVEASFFDSLLFSQTGVSLRTYYLENSYNQLDIVTVNLPSSLGWQTAPESYSYYVNGNYCTGGYPNNCQKLTEDIVDLIDPLVDFSDYDNDGDGDVDGLLLVHSGKGAEFTGSENDIWSHMWAINPRQKDGVNISKYSIQPEYWMWAGDMTIGVVAHETGHLLGLPDLYDIDYSSNGIGNWSLMSHGSWLGPSGMGGFPSHLDAWSKTQLGFVIPETISVSPSLIEIPEVENNPVIFRLWNNNIIGEEYYLIENRQNIGFDTYLPIEGILIWHIDEYAGDNTIEWYPGHTAYGNYLVALEQSDGAWQMEKMINAGNYSDPFSLIEPFIRDCVFNSNSIPSSKSYDNEDSLVCVEIASNNGFSINTVLSVDGDCQHVFTDLDNDNYSVCEGDCDDSDYFIHPGKQETCNYIDDDCDGIIDEGLTQTYYLDVDNDGYGTNNNTAQECTLPSGYAYLPGDCDDSNPNINPGAIEICVNGIDEDCDGLVDEGTRFYYYDGDNDGYGINSSTEYDCNLPSGYAYIAGDCDDGNPNVYPGAIEDCDNGIDDNCNDMVDDEENVMEICTDGIDNNCNGYTDSSDYAGCHCEGRGFECIHIDDPRYDCPDYFPYSYYDNPSLICSSGIACCTNIAPVYD